MSYLYKVEAKQVAQKEGSKLLGTASLTIDNQFKVTGIQIWEGKNGPYVTLPSYKSNQLNAEGKPVYKELFQASHSDEPERKSIERQLKSKVLEAFNQLSPIEYNSTSANEKKVLNKEGPVKISANMIMIPQQNGTIAYGSLRVGDFQLNSVQYRISAENPAHRYAAMPSYSVLENGQRVYHDVGYPTTKECRDRVQNAVREAYARNVEYQANKQMQEEQIAEANPFLEEVEEQTRDVQKEQEVKETPSQEKSDAVSRRREIRQELRANGFKATEVLVAKIERLDALTGKHNTLQDIKEMAKGIKAKTSGLSELSQDCVNEIVDEVQQQEIDAKAPKAPEPPMVEPA